MSDWAGFWLGLGFAAGCFALALGAEEFGKQLIRCVRFWKNGIDGPGRL